MKKFTATCLLAASFIFFGPILGGAVHSADKVCLLGTEAEFRADVARLKPVMLVASEAAVEKIMGAVNKARAARGIFVLQVDKIIVGVFKGQDGVARAGIAMFKDGCVVPGGVSVMSLTVFSATMTEMGVKFSDFRTEANA